MTEQIWKKCTKKPVEVEYREVIGEKETIKTREGELIGYGGKDYIIRGIRGEIYPIEKKIFEETYSATKEKQIPTYQEVDVEATNAQLAFFDRVCAGCQDCKGMSLICSEHSMYYYNIGISVWQRRYNNLLSAYRKLLEERK